MNLKILLNKPFPRSIDMRMACKHIIILLTVLIGPTRLMAGDNKIKSFQKKFIETCSQSIHVLHVKNESLILNGKLDSVITTIDVDLTNWKYNEVEHEWQVGSPTPEGSVAIPFQGNKYHYTYNHSNGQTIVEDSSVNFPMVKEFNDWQLNLTDMSLTQQYSRVLVYQVRIFNLPYFFINDKSTYADPDTLTSLYKILEDIGATDENKYKLALKSCDKIGLELKAALKSIRDQLPYSDQGVNYMVLMQVHSEPVLYNKKYRSFRYHNCFLQWIHEPSWLIERDHIQKIITQNLSLINSGSSVHDKKALENIISSIKCSVFGDCNDLLASLKNEWAIKFWNDFNALANSKGGTFFQDKLDRAIRITTAIEMNKFSSQSQLMYQEGLCHVDSLLCPGANLDEIQMWVDLATRLAVRYLIYDAGLEIKQLKGLSSQQILFGNYSLPDNIITVCQGDVEYDIQFSTQQSREKMSDILFAIGLRTNTYYDFYRINGNITNDKNTWGQYGYWLDEFYLKSCPPIIQMFARIVNPTLGIYEMCIGQDVFTGQSLSGWDYFFNSLDVFGVVGVVSDVTGPLFKSIRVSRAGKVMDLVGATKGGQILKTAFSEMTTAVVGIKKLAGKLVGWGKNVVYQSATQCIEVLDQTGQVILKLFDNKIEYNLNLAPAGGAISNADNVMRISGDIKVYRNGEEVRGSVEIGLNDSKNIEVRSAGKAISSVEEIKHLLKTNVNEAYFWSGKTNGIGGMHRALEIAQSKAGITLEGLIERHGIVMPVYDPLDEASKKLWEEVSAEYAKQVSGEVKAVIGQSLRPNNIWETFELPMLKNNPNVTKITIIDPETLVETVIFQR